MRFTELDPSVSNVVVCDNVDVVATVDVVVEVDADVDVLDADDVEVVEVEETD